MCDLVVVITKRSLSSEWKCCGVLRSFDLGIVPGESNKALVEMIQPFAQNRWSVALWVGGNEHDFNLINHIGWQVFQSARDSRHLKRTNIRTVSITKEK